MAFVVKSIVPRTGVRLQYIEHGERGGLPVVLLHGYSDSYVSFERVLPHLPESIHAIALTQRGHGDSGKPAIGYEMRDFSDDVAAFLDALCIEAAVIVGHSMGGLVAERFAVDYPERNLALCLAGTFLSPRANPSVAEMSEELARLTDPVEDRFVREFQTSTLARPVPTEFVETVIRESRKLPARVWRSVFNAIREVDNRTLLGSVDVPVLVIWGDRDLFSGRAEQEALVAEFSNVRFLVLEGAGHAPHWEDPVRFAADVAAFCEALALVRV
jgi:pimeloyl-ACP methyl ester carboxylesterase